MSDESVEMEGAAPEVEIEVATPMILDMGKTKAKQIKRLKKGKGPLMDEVVGILDEVADALGDELDGKMMVPIVILYKEKKKKKRTRIRFPF
ncbi:MAG: hypothetical protein DWQ04_09435 [Chloroflexi bacterium]|nr:MAG: hypothetical protein DWQ04_09435 [Chloroflexota bacterium]